MPNGEDWLEDPIKSRRLKSANDKQNGLWHSFHFSTRLKLDGADHFCRQVLGAASMPYDLGLPLLAHRQLKWNLDAFFFELMSANDILLQELNIIFAYDLGLKSKDVYWDKIKDKLPQKVAKCMDEERKKEWFDKIRNKYRNTTTHHRRVPTSSTKTWWGSNSLDSSHHVYMHYRDKEGNPKREEIGVCKDYLNNMVRYINSVWEMMAQEFQDLGV